MREILFKLTYLVGWIGILLYFIGVTMHQIRKRTIFMRFDFNRREATFIILGISIFLLAMLAESIIDKFFPQ